MSAQLVPVSVPGTDRTIMASLVDGRPMVSIRHACMAIGLEPARQIQKLNSRSWAGVYMTAIPSAGGMQQTAMVDRRTFTMWLATIDASRVSAEARPIIEAFQAEAADALDAYFNERAIAVPAMNQLDVLRAALDQIEAAQRDATEARQIAAKTEARLDAIEGKHDWFSAIAYARLHDLPTSTVFLRKLGACAGQIGRSHGIEPTQVQHQLYGWVNSWPAWVWDLAAEGFSA